MEINEEKQIAKIVSNQKGTGEKYQIIYNPNGAEGQEEIMETRQGFSVTLRQCDYIRKGYKFLEWNTKADGTGTKYENGANINIEQDITLYAIWKEPSTVIEAKEAGTVLSTTENRTLTDEYGNQVILPSGFKINSESADNVTGGVVIEDVSYTATAGSEFVWIPVGTVYTNETGIASETINLSRYTFAENGIATPHGAETITINYKKEYGDPNPDVNVNFDELAKSNLGNTVALNIEQFKTKIEKFFELTII